MSHNHRNDERKGSELNPQLLSLRDLTQTDVPRVLNYWYESPSEYIESMGVDLAKMVPRADFEQILLSKCRENESGLKPNINALIVEYAGTAIGFHTINPVHLGDFGIFHAHLWGNCPGDR